MPASKILLSSAAVTAALVLAGCGGSAKSAGSTPTIPGSSTEATSAGSSSPGTSSPASTGGSLTKADFVTQMNKVCNAVNTRVQALPQPAAATDFPNVIANLTGTVKEFPAFLDQVDSLVKQSPDAAELQQKWVTPEHTELANFTAAAAKVVADARAKDATKINTDITGLQEANSNSKTIGTYLTGYGLTECASLEDS